MEGVEVGVITKGEEQRERVRAMVEGGRKRGRGERKEDEEEEEEEGEDVTGKGEGVEKGERKGKEREKGGGKGEEMGASKGTLKEIENRPSTFADVTLPLCSMVRKVIDTEKLRIKFGTYEKRRALLRSFPLLLVEKNVEYWRLPRLLGKAMVRAQRFPIPIDEIKDVKSLEDGIMKALSTAVVVLRGQSVLNVRIGHVGLRPAQLEENVIAVMRQVLTQCENSWRDIESVVVEGEGDGPRMLVYAHNYEEELEGLEERVKKASKVTVGGGTNPLDGKLKEMEAKAKPFLTRPVRFKRKPGQGAQVAQG